MLMSSRQTSHQILTPTNCNYTSTHIVGETSGQEACLPVEHDSIGLMFAEEKSSQCQGDETDYKNSMSWNKFLVKLRCDGMQSCIKYMSHAASEDKWDMKGKVQLVR